MKTVKRFLFGVVALVIFGFLMFFSLVHFVVLIKFQTFLNILGVFSLCIIAVAVYLIFKWRRIDLP